MQPFIGEIITIPYNFAPDGWALCNGQLMSIAEYSTLFNLIGTTYGGDGQTTFALPNLQGFIAIGQGQGPGLSNYVMGESVGLPAVQLTASEIASHDHPLTITSSAANEYSPSDSNDASAPATSAREVYASVESAKATLAPTAIGITGSNQPHNNLQPYLVINYAISLFGIYPSQN